MLENEIIDTIEAFIREMRFEIVTKDAEKNGRISWTSIDYLYFKLKAHFWRLASQLNEYQAFGEIDKEKAKQECIHIANYCMLIHGKLEGRL